VARLGLGLSLLAAALIRLPHLRFVPIWDSRQYWDECLQPALNAPFDPLAFNCFGHRSMLYMLTIGWPQYFSQGSAVLLNLTHMVVALLTIGAFYLIAVRVFPPDAPPASGADAALLTLIFAVMPVWSGPSLNLNPDMGVLAAFLWTLALLMNGRRGWAIAAGLFLVLSKEIGLLLWLLLAAVDIALALWQPRASRARELLARAAYALPPLAYWATGVALQSKQIPANWPIAARQEHSLLRMFLTFDLSAPHYVAYAADIFLLNFAWVMTLVIVAWLVRLVTRILTRQPVLIPVADRRSAFILGIVAPAVYYLVTRYPTYNNVRYLLTFFPLLVLAFGAASVSLVRRHATRWALFAIVAALQLASMWRSADPVSRFMYGTFPFGRHDMLNMTSIRGECCGFGRDQLVYNLQFTHFHYVQDALFTRMRPGNDDVLAITRAAKWFLIGSLDAQTFRRTLRKDGVVQPKILTLIDVAYGAPLPERLRYVAYANVENHPDLALYARAYHIRGPFVVDEHGYRAAYFELQRRAVPLRVVPSRVVKTRP
jgi:hypothetical protein